MAGRQIKTPGVTESQQPEEQTKAEQTPDIQDASTESGVTESQTAGPVENSRIDEIFEGQKRIENKIDQLLKAGGIEAPKRMAWKQGKNGMELKEI